MAHEQITNINITPAGMQIIVPIVQGTAIVTTLDENTMNAVCAQWLETHKVISKALEVVNNGHVRK